MPKRVLSLAKRVSGANETQDELAHALKAVVQLSAGTIGVDGLARLARELGGLCEDSDVLQVIAVRLGQDLDLRGLIDLSWVDQDVRKRWMREGIDWRTGECLWTS